MNTRRALALVRFPIIGSLLFLTAAVGATAVQDSEPAKKEQSTAALFGGLTARGIGPASMSGRITDLAVDTKRPATFYVATATGGLWKTTNNATTWTPVFDNQEVSSIGAVALAPSDPNVIYVGTGEANARNSVSWGDG